MRKASFFTTIFLLLISFVSRAQGDNPEMADGLRSNGKIYVVVLVLATIFAGIIAFLVSLDRKIKKLEKNN
ncbi:CcmD family protein [Taibaiella soli]|uniref:CcmD family protein n=1 Tax=Taibaiella soli TaxID=1649169 RepID=A0A2W2ADM9_9BACT|nr:CcmD family protein [Taibaiella soli]PZF73555.1 CcmD family protein [Taibaiella soli]